MSRIRGRIIRIIDNTTVIINLGLEHGVESRSVFSILGMPEPIVDTVSSQTLGHVSVVKGKVRASEVFDKFTIATSKWTTYYSTHLRYNLMPDLLTGGTEEHGRELYVNTSDLQPWKAQTEDPVSVGDEVEVEIEDDIETEGRNPGQILGDSQSTGQENEVDEETADEEDSPGAGQESKRTNSQSSVCRFGLEIEGQDETDVHDEIKGVDAGSRAGVLRVKIEK